MALVLACLGRTEEAQKLAAAAVMLERELVARNCGSAWQRFELAQALHVAAVAGLGDANAQLAEADAIMKKLPARCRSCATWPSGRSASRRSGRRA